MIESPTRGGKTWAEVRDEYRAVVDAGDIRFDDRKILKLILELVRAKELDGAKELAKDLPRAPRIGELLVNIMPQMIFEGGVDVALQLYDEFFFEFDNRHVLNSRGSSGLFLDHNVI